MLPLIDLATRLREIAPAISSAWEWVREWLFYILPALSNLILVLLGVLLSLPDLADKIEKTPKYRKTLGVVCLLAGLVGFGFDVGQRRSSDQTNRQLLRDTGSALKKSDDLIDKTTVLVSSTNQMVTNFAILMPKVSALDVQIGDLNRRMEAAKGNPQLIAVLQGQIDTARAQSAAASRQILIGMVQTIVDRIDQRTLQFRMATLPDDLRRETPAEQKAIQVEYQRDMSNIIADADYIRQQLLQGQTLTSDDETQAATFKAAINGDSKSFDGFAAARYLDNLAKRASSQSH